MFSYHSRRLRLGAMLALIALCNPAFAQLALEEIIVTTTKRAEPLQSLPLSVSSISGEDLRDRGATDFFDYAVSIPNLSFGAATDGILSNRTVSLRGIQGTNTTGFYIDDTPVAETIDPRILDLERIEVLRGPSGTLYGARSLGGVIRHITRRPDTTETWGWVNAGASASDQSGDMNHLVSGSVNLALSDSAALVLSALNESQAGVFDRRVGAISNHLSDPASLTGPPNFTREDVDQSKVTALQAYFLFEPNERLSIAPRVLYQKTELDGFPLADVEPGNFSQNRDFDIDEGGYDEWILTTLNIDYDTGSGSFTSATSLFERETFETEASGSFINFLQALSLENGGFGLFDVIGVKPITAPIYQMLKFDSFVQEFRFASELDGRVNYVAGAFFQDTDDTEAFQPRNFAHGLNDNFAALQQTLGIPGSLTDLWPFGDLVFTSYRPTNVEEFGVFGEVTVDLDDKWSIVLGSRWFDTKVTFSEQQAGLAVNVPLADDAPLSSIPAEGGAQQEDGYIFKAVAEYRPTDPVLLYASVSEGFRLGGANGSIPDALGCPADLAELGLQDISTSSYASDDLVSYEGGFKADLGNAMRLNAALYHIAFEGIQQRIQLTCGFQFVGNFGKAQSQGIELEFTAQATENLLFSLNLGHTNAEYTESVAGVVEEGDPLQFVPEWTGSLIADYTAANAIANMDLNVRLDLSYVGESQSTVNAIPREREAYEQLGLRLSLSNERYRVTLYAKNLTNTIANLGDNRSIAAETPGRPRWVVSRPRTIGLELGVNF